MQQEKARGPKGNAMRAYGDMADAMEAAIGLIMDAKVSSIFLTHIDENEESDIRYGPAFPGKKLAQALDAIFDEVLCLRIARRTADSPKLERVLQCNPNTDPRYKTKDRSGALDDFELPDLGAIMTKIFQTTKEK
jgi:hypothetical protein